jgi:hypothetical protein
MALRLPAGGAARYPCPLLHSPGVRQHPTVLAGGTTERGIIKVQLLNLGCWHLEKAAAARTSECEQFVHVWCRMGRAAVRANSLCA